MEHKLSKLSKRSVTLVSLAAICVVTSFALGLQTAGEVQPFTLIEAGNVSLRGDVNGDGEVDIDDVILILEMSQEYIPTTPEAFNADPNEDGRITVDDALRILKTLQR